MQQGMGKWFMDSIIKYINIAMAIMQRKKNIYKIDPNSRYIVDHIRERRDIFFQMVLQLLA